MRKIPITLAAFGLAAYAGFALAATEGDAERGKEVQLLEHQLDAIPSRYELVQYQKRFVELDNQVAAEYAETQQFVTLYNTLQDQKA